MACFIIFVKEQPKLTSRVQHFKVYRSRSVALEGLE